METSLFEDQDVDHRPDPGRRRAVRRAVLGGILSTIRASRAWTVNDAASAAGIAPMTWRRLEEGLDVRQRTLTALDGVLAQPFGTVRRALDDDLVMVSLVGLADIDTAAVPPDEAAGFLDGLAARFRSGTVPAPSPTMGVASASLGGLVARVGGPSQSDLAMAVALIERITRRPMTPALDEAVKTLLRAMPDLGPSARPATPEESAAMGLDEHAGAGV